MRTTDERLFVVLKNVKLNKERRRQKRNLLFGTASVLGSVVFIIFCGVSMPDILKGTGGEFLAKAEGAASIFANSWAMGFVLIGLVSFLLGSCVTLLCYHLQHSKDKEDD